MDLVFVRSPDRRDLTIVTRRDGVRLSVPVVGKQDPLPHDLVHYVVERELDLDNGFWGSVADGAIFGGMRVLSGRQPPHAAERSRMLINRWAAQGGVMSNTSQGGVMSDTSKGTLCEITLDNWRTCVSLRVRPDQEEMVASNALSLAQAKYQTEMVPLGIYAGDQMVGFVMYGRDRDDGNYWIYRVMIDQHQQRKGYGRAAMQALLAACASCPTAATSSSAITPATPPQRPSTSAWASSAPARSSMARLSRAFQSGRS